MKNFIIILCIALTAGVLASFSVVMVPPEYANTGDQIKAKYEPFVNDIMNAKAAADGFMALYNADPNGAGTMQAYLDMKAAFAELDKYPNPMDMLMRWPLPAPYNFKCYGQCVLDFRACMANGPGPMGTIEALCTSGYHSCWYGCGN